MQVHTVELEAGRPTTELVTALELLGGGLVVLKWSPGEPTVATLYLPADDARKRTCLRLIADGQVRVAGLAGQR